MADPVVYPTKLLFICSRNRLRSLTAEKIFEGLAGFQARSAGTQPEARIVVNEGHIRWADLVFAMEKSHAQRLQQKFPEALAEKKSSPSTSPTTTNTCNPSWWTN